MLFQGPLQKSSGEGNGNPLQYSCLENPRDGGAWWAAVYGVAQSRTRLKRLSIAQHRSPGVKTSTSGSPETQVQSLVWELSCKLQKNRKRKVYNLKHCFLNPKRLLTILYNEYEFFLTNYIFFNFILFLFLNLKHCISFAKHQNESATVYF